MWTEGKNEKKKWDFQITVLEKKEDHGVGEWAGRINNEGLSQSCLRAPLPRKRPIVLISSFRRQLLCQVRTVNTEHRLWTQCFCPKRLSHGRCWRWLQTSAHSQCSWGQTSCHPVGLWFGQWHGGCVIGTDSDSLWLARSSLGRTAFMLTTPDQPFWTTSRASSCRLILSGCSVHSESDCQGHRILRPDQQHVADKISHWRRGNSG